VHFIHESLILNKFSSDEDFTRYDFGILAAKMYLTAMNKNVKRCQKYNREAGMWQCMAKIGYLNKPKTSKSPATLNWPGLYRKVAADNIKTALEKIRVKINNDSTRLNKQLK
jgi:hypothetical protein